MQIKNKMLRIKLSVIKSNEKISPQYMMPTIVTSDMGDRLEDNYFKTGDIHRANFGQQQTDAKDWVTATQ
ncbi:hypothetical protein AgCh_039449 [Apium graveolens]